MSDVSPGPGAPRWPRVVLPAGSVFVSDLHVDVDDAAAVEALRALLADLTGAPRVVFLGDVFEFWIGRAQGESPGGRRVLSALAETARAGTAVDVVPGNRDFLLDASFERASGAVLRPNGLVGELPGGRRMLVLHGDELCTADLAYQRLRRVLRSPLTLAVARRTPAAVSRALARRLRRRSTRSVAAKDPAVLAQDPSEVRRLAALAGADVLLCGHAHRFRDERLPQGPRWIVLDAFREGLDLARVGADGELTAEASTGADGAAGGGAAGG